jgi:dienelactone hydrolase
MATAVAIFACATLAQAAPLSADAFAYDASAPLGLKIVGEHHAGALTIQDITFASPKGGLIKGQLILPRTKTHRGGILFVHWLGDPKTTNLTEFHRDALTVAQRGNVALLIDAMWAAPDWYEKGRTPETDYANSIKQVIDLRRALDVLLAEPGVVSHRIAYVGHDFGAMYGAVLSGIDRRPRWYVLMAGNPSFEKWYTYEAKPKDPAAYSAQMAQLDPLQYLAQSKAEEMLLQFASKDQYISAAEAQTFSDAAPLPHGTFIYNTGHHLDIPEAFADRMAWLDARLNPAP